MRIACQRTAATRRKTYSLALTLTVFVCVAAAALSGCGKPPEQAAAEKARLEAAVAKAKREEQEANRKMLETVERDREDRLAAEQNAADRMLATQTRFEERLRSALIEPSSMQLRNEHLNANGTALCAEVNAKNNHGGMIGYRRVVVTVEVVSFDQDPDDTMRRPENRFVAIAQAAGCN